MKMRLAAGRAFALRHEDGGFTTIGMVVALLVALSLVFASAQVYRVNTASAQIQDVADAAVLAAENQVAEFMVVARVCDAVSLSLSLAGLATMGVGVAALCTPATQNASETLIKAARKMFDARDKFSKQVKEGLGALQEALPFLAAAEAFSVGQANSSGTASANYVVLAVLVPGTGKSLTVPTLDSGSVEDAVEQQADDIREAADHAQDAAEIAAEAKEEAFLHDCGNNPEYCMYERAGKLADMKGSDNPLYTSVDAWSFSVALERAKAYYPRRLAQEEPEGSSVREKAKSVLRKRFYEYAVSKIAEGYVHETQDSFEANFPKLPRNTDQLKETSLFYENAYPVTVTEDTLTMHAWSGCPAADGYSYKGSIAQLEAGGFTTCELCDFTWHSLGSVASASTNIENGFEYHYQIVADQAEEYEKAMERMQPYKEKVENGVSQLLDKIKQQLNRIAEARIQVQPPGSYGAIALVANTASSASSDGFTTAFSQSSAQLGTRAAVSGATLLEEQSGEGASVLASLLDGLPSKAGFVAGVAQRALDCWSGMLQAYRGGQQKMEDALAGALNGLPLASESGLGTWAAKQLKKLVASVGLQPASVDALKPVLVGTAQVASKGTAAFGVRYLQVQGAAVRAAGGTGSVFSSVAAAVEDKAAALLGSSYTLATIQPLGSLGPSIPLTITLPSSVQGKARGLVSQLAGQLAGVGGSSSEVRKWE